MTKLNILNRGYGYEPILDKKDDLKYLSFLLWEIINSIEDIENKFLCNDNLRLVGKQEFYDNNKNYLISFFIEDLRSGKKYD